METCNQVSIKHAIELDRLREQNARLTAALQEAAKLIECTRYRFPKSIRHPDTFMLNLVAAAISKAQS